MDNKTKHKLTVGDLLIGNDGVHGDEAYILLDIRDVKKQSLYMFYNIYENKFSRLNIPYVEITLIKRKWINHGQ